MIAGILVGELLGKLIGVQANVGGVGIAMLLLILLSDYMRKHGRLNPVSRQGVLFWSSIYIPVVVAMAAKQNVIAALVPVISRIGNSSATNPGDVNVEDEL
jgi:malonate transporter MadL subunit